MYEGPDQQISTSRRVLAKLDDGTTFLVEVDSASLPTEREVSGGIESYNFETIFSTIRSLSTKIVESLKESSPTKYTVELGFDVECEAGGFVAMLVKGKSTAKISVTLEWEKAKGHLE